MRNLLNLLTSKGLLKKIQRPVSIGGSAVIICKCMICKHCAKCNEG